MILKLALVTVLACSKASFALLIPFDVLDFPAQEVQSDLENLPQPVVEHNNAPSQQSIQSDAEVLGLSDIPYINDILNFFNENKNNDDSASDPPNEYGENDGKYVPDADDCDEDSGASSEIESSDKEEKEEGDDDDYYDKEDGFVGMSFEENNPISDASVSSGIQTNEIGAANVNDESFKSANIETSNATFNASFSAGIFIDNEEDEEEEEDDCVKKKWFWPFGDQATNSSNFSQLTTPLDPEFIASLKEAHKNPVPSSQLVKFDVVEGTRDPNSNDITPITNTGSESATRTREANSEITNSDDINSIVIKAGGVNVEALFKIPFFGERRKKTNPKEANEAEEVSETTDEQLDDVINEDETDDRDSYADPDNLYQTSVEAFRISSLSFEPAKLQNISTFSLNDTAAFSQFPGIYESSGNRHCPLDGARMVFLALILLCLDL